MWGTVHSTQFFFLFKYLTLTQPSWSGYTGEVSGVGQREEETQVLGPSLSIGARCNITKRKVKGIAFPEHK